MDPKVQQLFLWQFQAWPKADRKHLFLAEALHRAGAAMFGPEWSGEEPALAARFGTSGAEGHGADTASPTPASSNDAIREQAASRCRALSAADWIADLGRDGDLVTKGRFVSGGALFEVDAAIWNIEPIWGLRFARCRMSIWSADEHRDAYLFLTRESFEKAIAKLEYADQPEFHHPVGADDVWLSPFMKVLIEVAREAKLGPTPEQHADHDWIKNRILETAEARRVVGMSDSLARAAATLLRHPDAKAGLPAWKARLALEGSDPDNRAS